MSVFEFGCACEGFLRACRLPVSTVALVVAGGCGTPSPSSPTSVPSAPLQATPAPSTTGPSESSSIRESAPAAEPSTVTLDALGLRVDVFGPVKVGSGVRPHSVTVTSHTSGWRLTVEEGSSADTLDVARGAAERLAARNVQAQQTADGHWLTFQRTGTAGETYGVHVARSLGNKVYRCEGLVGRADEAREVLAACKTLRQ